MPEREMSSLDRFILNHASSLLRIPSSAQVSLLAMAFGGGLQLVLGIGLALVSVIALGPPLQWVLGIQGVAMILVGGGLGYQAWKKMESLKTEVLPAAPLSSEAKLFLQSLINRVGGWNWRGGFSPSKRERCADLLPSDVFAMLDEAANHYNRIRGMLADASPATHPTILKFAGEMKAATDEAMAHLLHQAGLMTNFPESIQEAEERSAEAVNAIRDLADRVGRLRSSGWTPAEAAPRRDSLN